MKAFEHKFCNKIVNVNFKKQYCIIGLDTLMNNLIEIVELYRDESNDFIVLDNKYQSNDNILCKELDKLDLDRMKCYSMDDCTEEELIRYFHLIYKSTEEFHIYRREII